MKDGSQERSKESKKLAERVGFEPTVRMSRTAAIRLLRLQPLSHLSDLIVWYDWGSPTRMTPSLLQVLLYVSCRPARSYAVCREESPTLLKRLLLVFSDASVVVTLCFNKLDAVISLIYGLASSCSISRSNMRT